MKDLRYLFVAAGSVATFSWALLAAGLWCRGL